MPYKDRLDFRILNSLLSVVPRKEKKPDYYVRYLPVDKIGQKESLRLSKEIHRILSDSRYTNLGRLVHSTMIIRSLKEGRKLSTTENNLNTNRRYVFVAGLPRSGTTNLHNTIINGFKYRGLKFWELVSPEDTRVPRFLDEKIRKIKSFGAYMLYLYLTPDMQKMHAISTSSYEECWNFFRWTGYCFNYYSQTQIEDYRSFIDSSDMVEQFMIYKNYIDSVNLSADPYGLKCPEHLMFFNELDSCFPNSHILWIHRDPVYSLGSFCKMMDTVCSLYYGEVDKKEIGAFLLQYYKLMLKTAINDRKDIQTKVIDISFNQLISDPNTLIDELFIKINANTKARIDKKKSKKNFKNKLKYSIDSYGLDRDRVEQELDFYYTSYKDFLI